MKLSHLALSALLLAASSSGIQGTQQDPKRPKSDTTKAQRKRPKPVKKTVKKDTIKGTIPSHKIISSDYCPPCGMG